MLRKKHVIFVKHAIELFLFLQIFINLIFQLICELFQGRLQLFDLGLLKVKELHLALVSIQSGQPILIKLVYFGHDRLNARFLQRNTLSRVSFFELKLNTLRRLRLSSRLLRHLLLSVTAFCWWLLHTSRHWRINFELFMDGLNYRQKRRLLIPLLDYGPNVFDCRRIDILLHNGSEDVNLRSYLRKLHTHGDSNVKGCIWRDWNHERYSVC